MKYKNWEVRRDIRNFEKEKTKEIMENSGSTRKLKKEMSRGRQVINKLKDKGGELQWGSDNVIRIATEFYSELYGNNQNKVVSKKYLSQSLKRLEETELPLPPIMEREVEHELQKLKTGKAPGPDKLDSNTVKKLSIALVKPLTKIFNKIIDSETSPVEWYLSEMIILYKKGCKADIQNYRPLSLSDSFYKIFMKI